MTLTPLYEVGWLIASHAGAAFAALLLGAYQFLAPKGTNHHKALGFVWCALMAWVAGSSLFIFTIRIWGPFSPIHVLSVLTLVFLAAGLMAARRRKVTVHRWIMISIYLGGLIIAGLFTLLPGRIMHDVFSGS